MFKIKIKRINLYAEWKLNAINDFCPICKNHVLNNSVINEINKKNQNLLLEIVIIVITKNV